MAYDDWDAEFREVFDELPGISYFREYELEQSEELFELAFTHHADEDNYDPDAVHQARQDFFDFTGIPEELFDWDGWREAMGYE